ncbi:MAG: hypothetical protein K0R53_2909 [Burkholderiales bacterium]|nr:hypothetical protein [Burkholderiales bacterium]
MRNILSAIAAGVAAVAIGALLVNPSLAADNRTPQKRVEDRAAADYRTKMKRADAIYTSAAGRCKTMTDKDRLDCLAQASAVHKSALMHARAQHRAALARAEGVRRKEDYEAALKCESLRGKARDECRLDDGKPKYGLH